MLAPIELALKGKSPLLKYLRMLFRQRSTRAHKRYKRLRRMNAGGFGNKGEDKAYGEHLGYEGSADLLDRILTELAKVEEEERRNRWA